jgi:hypothetical protein
VSGPHLTDAEGDDAVPRLAAFKAAHHDITIERPAAYTSLWKASRDGRLLAARHQLSDLLNDLARKLAEPARVITVCQPYARAIVAGVKTTEERHWSPSWRGRLWVHADAETDAKAPAAMWPPTGRLVTSAVLGYVTLADIEGKPGAWRWVLTDPVELAEPVTRVRGHPGLWLIDLPPNLR